MIFDHAKAALGDKFDKPDLRMVADGSKVFKNVFGECFENKTMSLCSNNSSESLISCGKGAKGLFLNAVAAGTLPELAAAKEKVSVNASRESARGTGTTPNFDLAKFDCDCHKSPHCAHLSEGSKAKGSCIAAYYKAAHTVAHWKFRCAPLAISRPFHRVPRLTRAAICGMPRCVFLPRLKRRQVLPRKCAAPGCFRARAQARKGGHVFDGLNQGESCV